MEKVVIVELGVEGGGVTVYGRRVDGVWSFWGEGSSMYLDENDDIDWRHWSSEPVSTLAAALTGGWREMSPIEVHPEFVPQLRAEYMRSRSRRKPNGFSQQLREESWEGLLSVKDLPRRPRRYMAAAIVLACCVLLYLAYTTFR